MKLKIDENGHIVVQDGKPVYVYDDNGVEKEMVFDAPATLSKITALNKEAGDHRKAKNKLAESLEAFKGIDADEAKKAIATVKNLDDKKLVDAGEVDKLKNELNEIYTAKETQILTEHKTQIDEFKNTITTQEEKIRNLLLNNEFAQSEWFVSKNERPSKTILPPDMGAKFFGDYFKIEDGKPVGYLNGDVIRSTDPQNLGNPADFNTAITMIIEQYPAKSQILRSTSGGAGTKGNELLGEGNVISLTKAQMKDPEIYRAAKEKASKGNATIQVV